MFRVLYRDSKKILEYSVILLSHVTVEEGHVRYYRIVISEYLAPFFTAYFMHEKDTFERAYEYSCCSMLSLHLLEWKCSRKLDNFFKFFTVVYWNLKLYFELKHFCWSRL